ncbi:MAG: aminotransferase class [Gemmatimonadetes bacterium]|nr:aminotransferase class [Gemmatimonadota bacterium]
MPTRRDFVAQSVLAAAAIPRWKPTSIRSLYGAMSSGDGAPDDESYWQEIQRAFDLDRSIINLNNGGCSPAPTMVLEQMIRDVRFSNELPVQHMWQVLEPRVEAVRRELAIEFGCDPEEMAITRNASESNETVIFGTDMKAGDEAIITTLNYPRMQNAWRQRELRDGVVVKRLKLPTPIPSDDVFVKAFADAITPRTKVIEIMHLSFQTGYVAPVRKIMELVRGKGITVLVDGAHAFAHFPMSRDELGADFYGTSLHKWLMAPIGTGFLYVRRNRVKDTWPLLACTYPTEQDDIRKYEQIGTHPAANHNAIAVALTFNRGIGQDRKTARLRFLRDRWAKRLVAYSPRVKMITSLEPGAAGALAVVTIEGMDIGKLQGWLWGKHQIMTTPLVGDEFQGLRVTPNVYTMTQEIDRFSDAMEMAIKVGVA